MPNVLIVFCSRLGTTELQATAAAVGVVQARGSIRLRWLKEAAEPEQVAAVPGWAAAREQMERDYIAPREADLEWADGLILCSPAGVLAESAEWRGFFGLMKQVRPKCRVGAVVGDSSLEPALSGLGIECVSSGPDARAVGNRVGQLSKLPAGLEPA